MKASNVSTSMQDWLDEPSTAARQRGNRNPPPRPINMSSFQPGKVPPWKQRNFVIGEEVNLKFAEIIDPSHVWCTFENVENHHNAISQSIREKPIAFKVPPSVNQYCAVLVQGRGIRALILKIDPCDKNRYCLLFIDSGAVCWRNLSDMCILRSSLCKKPWQAIFCSMSDIIPLNGVKWSNEEVNSMFKVVEEFLADRIIHCKIVDVLDIKCSHYPLAVYGYMIVPQCTLDGYAIRSNVSELLISRHCGRLRGSRSINTSVHGCSDTCLMQFETESSCYASPPSPDLCSVDEVPRMPDVYHDNNDFVISDGPDPSYSNGYVLTQPSTTERGVSSPDNVENVRLPLDAGIIASPQGRSPSTSPTRTGYQQALNPITNVRSQPSIHYPLASPSEARPVNYPVRRSRSQLSVNAGIKASPSIPFLDLEIPSDSIIKFQLLNLDKDGIRPNSLFLHLTRPDMKCAQKIEELSAKMAEFYKDSRNQKDTVFNMENRPLRGEFVCIQKANSNEMYRGEILGRSGSDKYNIRLIDKGFAVNSSPTYLRKLDGRFMNIPALAVKAILSECDPVKLGDGWTRNAIETFKRLLHSHTGNDLFEGLVVENKTTLQVIMFIETAPGVKKIVNHEMVQLKMASSNLAI